MIFWFGPSMMGQINHEAVFGTHDVRAEIDFGPPTDIATSIALALLIDGQRHVVKTWMMTREDLLDAFERAHHEHHGMDPRGLDPRQGPTRLHPGPGR